MKSEKLHTKITRGWCIESLLYNGHGNNLDYFRTLLLTNPNSMAKTWLSNGLHFKRTTFLKSYLYIKRINDINKKK